MWINVSRMFAKFPFPPADQRCRQRCGRVCRIQRKRQQRLQEQEEEEQEGCVEIDFKFWYSDYEGQCFFNTKDFFNKLTGHLRMVCNIPARVV